MVELAGSFVFFLVALALYVGPVAVVAYVFYRSARRVTRHMDRVETELATLNRRIAEFMSEAAR